MDISTVRIVIFALTYSDEPNFHITLGNAQEDQMHLPQALTDFPVMCSSWFAFDQMWHISSGNHCHAKFLYYFMGSASSMSYLIYNQSHVSVTMW